MKFCRNFAKFQEILHNFNNLRNIDNLKLRYNFEKLINLELIHTFNSAGCRMSSPGLAEEPRARGFGVPIR